MTNHPNRSKRGRPPKAEGEHRPSLNVTLDPATIEYLRACPLGPAREIDRLVAQARGAG